MSSPEGPAEGRAAEALAAWSATLLSSSSIRMLMLPLTLLRLLRFCSVSVLLFPTDLKMSSIVAVPRNAPFVSGPCSNFGLFHTCRVSGTP
jgi:hypothetical protein